MSKNNEALVSYSSSGSESIAPSHCSSASEQSVTEEIVMVPKEVIPPNAKTFTINIRRASHLDSMTKVTRHVLEDVSNYDGPDSISEESVASDSSEICTASKSNAIVAVGGVSKDALRKRKYRAVSNNRERENQKRRERYKKRNVALPSELVQKFDPAPHASVQGGFMPYEQNLRIPVQVTRQFCDGELRVLQVLRRYEIETWYHQWIPNVNGTRNCNGKMYALQDVMGERSVVNVRKHL
ncbi:hypothetical protein FGB62_166g031 [Gracilaria domingensis]|nr:hypothetical protein FGB62_166g031 [Gracilaria domingensis]